MNCENNLAPFGTNYNLSSILNAAMTIDIMLKGYEI